MVIKHLFVSWLVTMNVNLKFMAKFTLKLHHWGHRLGNLILLNLDPSKNFLQSVLLRISEMTSVAFEGLNKEST